MQLCYLLCLEISATPKDPPGPYNSPILTNATMAEQNEWACFSQIEYWYTTDGFTQAILNILKCAFL